MEKQYIKIAYIISEYNGTTVLVCLCELMISHYTGNACHDPSLYQTTRSIEYAHNILITKSVVNTLYHRLYT